MASNSEPEHAAEVLPHLLTWFLIIKAATTENVVGILLSMILFLAGRDSHVFNHKAFLFPLFDEDWNFKDSVNGYHFHISHGPNFVLQGGLTLCQKVHH